MGTVDAVCLEVYIKVKKQMLQNILLSVRNLLQKNVQLWDLDKDIESSDSESKCYKDKGAEIVSTKMDFCSVMVGCSPISCTHWS